MSRPDPPLPEGPLGKAFIRSLMEEFATNRGMTLEDYLREADQGIATEENYLDAPGFNHEIEHVDMSEEEFNEIVLEDYRDYRDNKRWLDED